MTTSHEMLLLVPTAREAEALARAAGIPAARIHICGFGPVAAAATTAALLSREKPRTALLAGIAGSYDLEAFPLGEALSFSRVVLDGVGAGEGDGFIPASQLGFPQWPGNGSGPAIGDELQLEPRGSDPSCTLITVCSASGSAAEAERRRARYPGAIAEDMEGFGVALACALAGVRLRIVRGASNAVGDREAARWKIGAALAAAGSRLKAILKELA